jgi:hypothetical protein
MGIFVLLLWPGFVPASTIVFEMSMASSTSDHLPTFDGVGRLIQLTETEIRKRNLIALAALDAIQQIGDAVEQRETLDYLKAIR